MYPWNNFEKSRKHDVSEVENRGERNILIYFCCHGGLNKSPFASTIKSFIFIPLI